MNVISTKFEGLIILEPTVFEDKRGFFMENWSQREFERAGLHYDFVQDNYSFSEFKGTLRGIHFQRGKYSQAKLVCCIKGAVLDIAVDLRPWSRSYKQWLSTELSEKNRRQLLIPKGFGHGFLTLTDNVGFFYKADEYYVPDADCGIRWNDPELGIVWGVAQPILSHKDEIQPFLRDTITGY